MYNTHMMGQPDFKKQKNEMIQSYIQPILELFKVKELHYFCIYKLHFRYTLLKRNMHIIFLSQKTS